MLTALTIAGSDSGGGAGIQADLKTFAAHGVHGVCAVTAVTAQNTHGVSAIHAVPADVVAAQIESVVGDIGVAAVKTGMLVNRETVETVARCLHTLSLPFVVVDPVMVSSSGTRLLEEDAVATLINDLLPIARCVTPNREEAERLSGCPVRSDDDVRRAARRILDLGPDAVVITGGHFDRATVVDVLFDGEEFRHARRSTASGLDDPWHRLHLFLCPCRASRPGHSAWGGRATRQGLCLSRHPTRGRYRFRQRTGRPRAVTAALLYSRKVGVCVFSVTHERLTADAVLAAVGQRRGTSSSAGGVTSFLGLVRDENLGKRVLRLEYEGYEPLAVKAFERIATEAETRWPDVILAVHHRLGTLQLGETSVGDCGLVTPSRRGVCSLSLRDRARQTDRAHLETRIL